MGTSLLAALRRAYPNAHITWIAEHTETQAIDANPYIDEILRWDGSYWKRMVRKLQYLSWFVSLGQFRRELKLRHYDIFISFQPEEWPLLVLGSGAPLSIAIFDTFKRYYGASRNLHYQKFYTHSFVEPRLPAHRIDQYLLSMQALGLPSRELEPMSMGYTQEDASAAEDFLRSQGISPEERFVVLAPMTTWPTKCWPADRYVALGDALASQHSCRIVVMGSAKERLTLENIASFMKTAPVVMAGELNFRQAAALLDRAALLVSGDTGPMHVASALKVPQVALFGATSPNWYGPRTDQALTVIHPVPCGPCDKKMCRNAGDNYLLCLQLISVDEVLRKAAMLIKK